MSWYASQIYDQPGFSIQLGNREMKFNFANKRAKCNIEKSFLHAAHPATHVVSKRVTLFETNLCMQMSLKKEKFLFVEILFTRWRCVLLTGSRFHRANQTIVNNSQTIAASALWLTFLRASSGRVEMHCETVYNPKIILS